jgi:hypothetical protein
VARDALTRFFFPGVDLHTDRYDTSASVDVETQALLHFDQQVTVDMRDSQEPERFPPLCVGQADLLADDTLRLLAYEPHIPRSVLVEYLKTLFAFHLGVSHLRTIKLLPALVRRRGADPTCEPKNCPVAPRRWRRTAVARTGPTSSWISAMTSARTWPISRATAPTCTTAGFRPTFRPTTWSASSTSSLST